MTKENEIDELLVSLNGLRISCLLACHEAELSIRSEVAANQTIDLTNVNEAVKMIKREEIDAYSSKIMHGQTKTMLQGNKHVCSDAGPERG